MKTMLTLSGRIIVMLVAALLVVGVMMQVVDTSATGQFPPERSDSSAQTATVAGTADTTASVAQPPATTQGSTERAFHGPGDQSLTARLGMGLFGSLPTLGIIGAMVLVVTWLERRFSRQPARATG